ncbi:MAG: hypothetical protein BM560_19095 [Roseobacter sp. MedPE-SWde]|nr:MAG: hypothetical protein BM560_19095 [Roseobacter sp. MedPE-SWde]
MAATVTTTKLVTLAAQAETRRQPLTLPLTRLEEGASRIPTQVAKTVASISASIWTTTIHEQIYVHRRFSQDHFI